MLVIFIILIKITAIRHFFCLKSWHSIIPLLLFLLSSCNSDPKLGFTEVEITTEHNTLVEIHIPMANGDQTLSSVINNELERVVDSILALAIPQPNPGAVSIKNRINEFNQSYKNFIAQFPNSNQNWEVQIDGEIIYHSSDAISIAFSSYINTGGAHGSTSISFLNFDGNSGKRISNTNLFHDIDSFRLFSKHYFDKAVVDKSILFEPDSYTLPANIGFTEDGVILLYNPYEIAPYASGIIEFTIPYEDAKAYLTIDGF